MPLEYGKSAYNRTRGNLPPLETVNMFVEASQSQGVVMQSRPPLNEITEVGAGPVQASVVRDGVFDGDRFTISGGQAYRGATLLGAVSGSGPASIAVRAGEVLFNAGGPLYSYNGTNFIEVTFPDDSNVTKVFYTSGYFIALEAGTGYWFFSGVNDGRSWDALDFAEVETEPDAILDAVVLDGVIAFGGKNSIEFWAPTGNADLPFAPIQQRVFEQGVIASGCMVQDDNTFFWIGADKIPYRNGDVPQAIGGDFLVERIEASSTYRMYLLQDQRHKFVCIRLDDETWAYDITTGEPTEFRSYGRSNFRCGPDFGDDETGKVWEFGEYGSATETLVERIVTAGERLLEPKIYSNVTVECEVGTTPYLTGTYAEPTIEFRTSDDGGNVWEDWLSDTLGEQGDYRKIIEYRALGMFNLPGFLSQIRITDPRAVSTVRLLRQCEREREAIMAIAPIRLDRLLRFDRVADANGMASGDLQAKWQRVMEEIESSVNAVIDAQNAADAANAAAAAADAAAAAADAAATAAQGAAETVAADSSLASSGVTGLTMTATDAGTDATITISGHTRIYGDGTSVAVTGGSITGLAYSTGYYVYYDQSSRLGGAVIYQATTSAATAAQTGDRHSLGAVTTPAAAGPPNDGNVNLPPGVVEF